MEFQKTINVPEETSNNKDLLKKGSIRKIIIGVMANKLRKPNTCYLHKLWFYCIKMKFQKIVNFIDTTSGNKYLPKFVTKKWIEVYDQS